MRSPEGVSGEAAASPDFQSGEPAWVRFRFLKFPKNFSPAAKAVPAARVNVTIWIHLCEIAETKRC